MLLSLDRQAEKRPPRRDQYRKNPVHQCSVAHHGETQVFCIGDHPFLVIVDGFFETPILIYIAALICSHLAAFRVQANMRTKAMHHIVTLPMGFMDGIGSGKVRKIVYESSAATETYLAHQLPKVLTTEIPLTYSTASLDICPRALLYSYRQYPGNGAAAGNRSPETSERQFRGAFRGFLPV